MQESQRLRLILVIVLALLFVGDVVLTETLFTSQVPGANDFFSRWEGARAFWLDGLDPYSDEVTVRIQLGIYGRLAEGDEDPGPFAYPFYTAFTLWPLVTLPYSWVQAIWLSLLEFAMVAIGLMSMSLVRWKISPLTLGAVILFSLFFYNSTRAILLGQYAVVVAALVIGSMLAIRLGHDNWAGVMLAFTTMKPQMVFLIIPYVLLWSAARRRWRVARSFAVSMAILLGLSFVLLPSWLDGFLRQLGSYTSYTAIGSPVWVIVQYYLGLGDVAELIVSGLIGSTLIMIWVRTIGDERWGTFQWVSGLTLIVSNLIALRTATTNYVILFPALWLVARAVLDRWPQQGRWLVAGGALSLLVSMWLLFAVTVVGKFEHPLVYLPLPFGLAFAFVFARRRLLESADG